MAEEPSDKVPWRPRSKQAEELHARWAWVEPSAWTTRMLAALERGVKGGKWFVLMDKVYKPANLAAALDRVVANKGSAGIDHVSAKAFDERREVELDKLHEALVNRSYQPSAIRRVHIPKPGRREKRPLGVPTVRDRTVQTALRQVIEPIYERTFSERSYGFRPGRGCKDALREVDRLLKAGSLHVVEVDICKFFDTLDHEILMERVTEQVADGGVISLIKGMLKQGVMEQGREWTPEEGTPQGGPISPLLANIYLNPLDHQLAAAGFQSIRYADDLVILCRTLAEAEAAKAKLEEWVEANGLKLHPEKTRLVDMNQREAYVDFLGYRFKRTKGKGELRRYPSDHNIIRLRQNLKPYLRRANGKSLEEIIRLINPKLKGWFAYFKHSSRYAFEGIDRWLRMRLRSILRKRHKGKGRGRGLDHFRWPNAYFAKLGLFSLVAAHAEVRQSAPR